MGVQSNPLQSKFHPSREQLSYLILAGIIFCGFILRYIGINYDLPYSDRWEETVVLHNALKILKTGDFHPYFMGYPGLSIYLNAFVFILAYFYAISSGLLTSMGEVVMNQDFVYLSHPTFYMAGRLLSVILGSMSILFTFKLGEKFHSRKTGLLAALFLAFSFAHIEESRFIHPDILTGLMAAITLLECFYIMDLGEGKFYLLAGLFAGFTIGSKYNAFFIILPLISAHLLSDKKSHFFNTNFFIMALFVFLGFVMVAPYTFIDLPGFLHWAGIEVLYYKRVGYWKGASNEPGWPQAIHYLKYYYYSGMGGLVLTICALAGIGLGFVSRWKKQLMFFSFPGIYFIYMCMQKINFTKNMIPTLPFMAVMGALTVVIGVDFLVRYFQRIDKFRSIVIAGVALILIYPSLSKSIEFAREMRDYRDSRSLVAVWLKDNVPAAAQVAIMNETWFFKRDLDGVAFTIDWFDHIEHPYSWYRENGYQYIVTSDRYAFRHWVQITGEQKKQAAQYNNFFSGVPLAKRFGDDVLRLDCYSKNPVITVLKVKPL